MYSSMYRRPSDLGYNFTSPFQSSGALPYVNLASSILGSVPSFVSAFQDNSSLDLAAHPSDNIKREQQQEKSQIVGLSGSALNILMSILSLVLI